MVNEMKQVIKSDNAPKALGPYSQAIKVGKMVFLSGQLGLDPKTNDFVNGGVSEQAYQSLSNLKAVLESEGLTLASVVKTTVFLKDLNDFQAMNVVYGEFFKTEPPARSTIQAGALPKGGLVEIDAIAILE
jgi:2-iminobutanoate/2-iminopropanoate deaminase